MEDSSLIDEVLDRYRKPHLIAKGGGDPEKDDSAIAVTAAFHDLSFATRLASPSWHPPSAA